MLPCCGLAEGREAAHIAEMGRGELSFLSIGPSRQYALFAARSDSYALIYTYINTYVHINIYIYIHIFNIHTYRYILWLREHLMYIYLGHMSH